MNQLVSIELLADHRELPPLLQRWFEAEWPAYYGPNGQGDAGEDLRAIANRGSLPIGFVALRHGVACGVAALKRESIASRGHLSPWAAAGLVLPVERRKGIGSLLLAALEGKAHKLGFPFIYCGTGTAHTLLRRRAWEFMEWVAHDGQSLGIYRKALSARHPTESVSSLADAGRQIMEDVWA